MNTVVVVLTCIGFFAIIHVALAIDRRHQRRTHMSATSMGDRTPIQEVVRRVPCPTCPAKVGEQCYSGIQKDKYRKNVPDSHTGRWKIAIDAGHFPDHLEDLR